MRGPLVATDLFLSVMKSADNRCQCPGTCGREHREGVCGVKASHRVRLIAAPATVMPDHQAVALPSAALRAWCPSCLGHARADVRVVCQAVAADAQESLF